MVRCNVLKASENMKQFQYLVMYLCVVGQGVATSTTGSSVSYPLHDIAWRAGGRLVWLRSDAYAGGDEVHL